MISKKSRILVVLLMVIVAGSVHAEDAKEVVVSSAEELKGVKANEDHLEERWGKNGVGEALCSYPV